MVLTDSGVALDPVHDPNQRTYHTLENGLQVVVVEDYSMPAVAVCLAYRVGSRNEQAGKTGFAHLFEHLMFQGSRSLGANEHDEVITQLGGTHNAVTRFDATLYFETVPSNHLATALWLEADRMGTMVEALDQKILDNERDVVKNERRQDYDNQPYGSLWEVLTSATFPENHPYAHIPIGSMTDISAASLRDCEDFWRTYYGPDNALLTIVGDTSAEEARSLVEKYFGTIPPIQTPRPALSPMDSAVSGRYRLVVMTEEVPAERFVGVWRIPAGSERHLLDVLNLLEAVLSSGDSSRLHQHLVFEEKTATEVTFFPVELAGGESLAVVDITLSPAASLQDVERGLGKVLADLAENGPTPLEMDLARADIESNNAYALETLMDRARALADGWILNDDPWYTIDKPARTSDVTAERVASLVREYLTPDERTTLFYSKKPHQEEQS